MFKANISGTCCLIFRSIINKLGPERISKVKIVGNEEARQSLYSQVVLGQAKHSGLDEQLAKEAMKAGSPFSMLVDMLCESDFILNIQGWILKGCIIA